MAGSFDHIAVMRHGELRFRGVELLDDMGDAYEAIEEMFDMIEHLSGGDMQKLREAHKAHCLKRNGFYEERDRGGWLMPHDEDDHEDDEEREANGN
jgi:hypothetical protein